MHKEEFPRTFGHKAANKPAAATIRATVEQIGMKKERVYRRQAGFLWVCVKHPRRTLYQPLSNPRSLGGRKERRREALSSGLPRNCPNSPLSSIRATNPRFYSSPSWWHARMFPRDPLRPNPSRRVSFKRILSIILPDHRLQPTNPG